MKDLVRYLNEIVEPTVADLQKNPTSVRHAFLACVAVFHAIDYLAYPRKSRGFRQKFRMESPEFADGDGGVTLATNVDVELLYVLKRAMAFLRKQTEGVQT